MTPSCLDEKEDQATVVKARPTTPKLRLHFNYKNKGNITQLKKKKKERRQDTQICRDCYLYDFFKRYKEDEMITSDPYRLALRLNWISDVLSTPQESNKMVCLKKPTVVNDDKHGKWLRIPSRVSFSTLSTLH